MNVDEILSKVNELPPMPQMAIKVINLLDDPDFSFAELIALISKDANITATVLKLANSPLFSVKNEITNLTQAMTFLGVKNIKNLVISLSTKVLFSKGKIKLIDQKLWEFSVATAIYSRILSLKVDKKIAEEAFLLGLLHTIGQVILSKNLDDYEELVSLAYNDDLNILLLEKEKYGFDNYDLAAVTMKVWNMPEIYYQVLSSLKKPENSQHRELTYIVLLSNIFVTEKGINITKYINEELKLVAIDYFGLKQDVLEELDEIFEDIYSKEKELFKL
jgi:HD-like signal output (HDOD) protein